MAKVAERATPFVSVTVTEKFAFPTAGGVPVNTPAGLTFNQAGRPVADHVYTPVPPVATKVCE